MNYFKLTASVVLLAIPFSSGVCTAPAQEKIAPDIRSIQTTKSIEEFWSSFQAALKKRDLEKLTQLTRFPLGGDISSVVKNLGATQPEGFRKNFNACFPKSAIRSILSNSTKSLRFTISNGQETWRFDYLEKGSISEQDWGIIYTFKRLKDGNIRLASIDFAG